ncbi:MAG: flagellar protein FlaG [Bacillota bacterium]
MRVEGVTKSTPVKPVQPVGREIKDVVQKGNKELGEQQGEQRKILEKDLINSIKAANRELQIYDKKLEFSIHEKTKEIVVKIVDTSTEEVLKEIPSQKILDMIANMMELAGLLVDERA